jgi:hypothetical protein
MLKNYFMEMSMENLQNSDYRYERKFFIQQTDRNTVINMVLMHPAFFSEIFHERWVNNIYYDFFTLNNFMDNINGHFDRTKYRIRWYGEMKKKVEKSKLEIKIKKGAVGFKQNFDLQPFLMDNDITKSKLDDVFSHSAIDAKIQWSLKEQMPVLLNRYRRRYFISHDSKFRFTIDDKQSFYKIGSLNNTFLRKHIDSENIILELKYNNDADLLGSEITNRIPYRMTKSSKYSNGIQLLYY